ncbi:hypothetical protein [Actinomadura sp. 7K534]|uniref:hypothetical protein n=1 Tax=Actinomadura sp. 7K534 TaxID=2530366 RepID=UPI001405053D|nr:hypothetical protein [Actinomadura sp. 7K534]
MTGLAVAMDLAAVGYFAGFLFLVTRRETVPGGEGGRTVAMILIAVSLALLSVPLWSLP